MPVGASAMTSADAEEVDEETVTLAGEAQSASAGDSTCADIRAKGAAGVGYNRQDARCPVMPPVIFRKGLDLKAAVAGELADAYHSHLVDAIRADGFVRRSGRLTVHLAREFGFCYGVDRAVDYA
jgi:hypothetical protein